MFSIFNKSSRYLEVESKREWFISRSAGDLSAYNRPTNSELFLFSLPWLPLYTYFIIIHFDPPPKGSEEDHFLLNTAVPISRWLGQANSGMNPIIYCFFSKAIKKRTITLLSCSSQFSSHLPRRQSRLNSSRCMSTDYANCHITLRLKGRKDSSLRSTKCTNAFCESIFYDWLALKRFNCWSCKKKTDI